MKFLNKCRHFTQVLIVAQGSGFPGVELLHFLLYLIDSSLDSMSVGRYSYKVFYRGFVDTINFLQGYSPFPEDQRMEGKQNQR